MSAPRQTQAGFTIVELLIVIVIIGILAAISIVAYTGITQKAVIASLVSDLNNAVEQLKIDQVHNSKFPDTLALANGGKNIPASAGTVYQYIVNNSGAQTFCIAATKSNQTYSLSLGGPPLAGACPTLRLDAGNTSSYPGAGLVWTDVSGNVSIGTLMNGVGYSATNGGALTFDGVDDKIMMNSGVPLGRSLSIDVVGKVNSTAVDNNFVSVNPPAFIRVVGGKVRWNLYIQKDSDSTLSWAFNNGNIAILPNVIYDLTMTYDGATLKGYVNGVQDISLPFAGQVTYSQVITVGFTTGGEDAPLGGSVYSLKVYDKALQDGDVKQNFNAVRARYGL